MGAYDLIRRIFCRLNKFVAVSFVISVTVLLNPAAGHADAGTTGKGDACTLGSSPNGNFGAVNNFSGSASTTTFTISVTCSKISQTEYFCIQIASGKTSGSGRILTNSAAAANNQGSFQIYQDSANSTIWGSSGITVTSSPTIATYGNGGLSASMTSATTNSYTAYATFSKGQTSLVPGSYSWSADVVLIYGPSKTAQTCSSYTTGPGGLNFYYQTTLTVTATISPTCLITNGTLDFGSLSSTGLTTAAANATGNFTIQCTNTTSYNITLGNGYNFSTTRRMKSAAGSYLNYDLYKDSGRANSWSGNNLVTGTGAGTSQSINVYGTIPQQTSAPASGTYTDTVAITATY